MNIITSRALFDPPIECNKDNALVITTSCPEFKGEACVVTSVKKVVG